MPTGDVIFDRVLFPMELLYFSPCDFVIHQTDYRANGGRHLEVFFTVFPTIRSRHPTRVITVPVFLSNFNYMYFLSNRTIPTPIRQWYNNTVLTGRLSFQPGDNNHTTIVRQQLTFRAYQRVLYHFLWTYTVPTY